MEREDGDEDRERSPAADRQRVDEIDALDAM